MEHPILAIVMRYLHIVSAVVAVGSLCFIPFVLKPALRLVEDNLRQTIETVITNRFHTLLWICIVGLTVSGAYNWWLNAPLYRAVGPLGNSLLGTKVLLALIMFAVVAGRTAGLLKNVKLWQMVNIHLAAAVILLGSILRVIILRHLQQG